MRLRWFFMVLGTVLLVGLLLGYIASVRSPEEDLSSGRGSPGKTEVTATGEGVLTAPGVTQVRTDPDVFYLWETVPDDLRQASLDLGELSNIRPGDYAGPEECETCHAENYAAWQEHRHRWMNAPAGEATVKGAFAAGEEIEYYGGRATFYKRGDGYRMRLVRDALHRTYEVTQTLGSRFFQYYVGRQLDGPEEQSHEIYHSEHVLPFGYWIDRGEWVPVVHVENARAGEPSLPDSMRRDPFANPAVFDYAQRCSRCHTTLPLGDWLVRRQRGLPPSPREFSFLASGYLSEVRPKMVRSLGVRGELPQDPTAALKREIEEIKAPVWGVTSGITCEACHHGCQLHLADESEPPKFFPVSPHVFVAGNNETRDEDLGRNSGNLNWTCARCHSGNRFEFAGGMATWNSVEYSDAIKGACYESHSQRQPLTCVHCHDPHQTIGQGWQNTPAEDDDSCLACHEELAAAAPRQAHTRHPPGSPGSRCMNCHMPRINEGLQDMVRTHVIFSPTDRAMLEANQPNACNLCHVEKPVDWTLEYLEEWYGKTYSEEKLAESQGEHRTRAATLSWLRSSHMSTRMVATDALARSDARWALPHLVRQLDSRYLMNRQFARIGLERMVGKSLSEFGYRFYMFKGERQESLTRIRTALLENPADPEAFENEGELDSIDERIAHYTALLRANPDHFEALYNLGTAFRSKGQLDVAVKHYGRALEIQPRYVELYYDLGVTHVMKHETQEALRHFRKVLELDPKHTRALNSVATSLRSAGNVEEALSHLRKALEFDPDYSVTHYNLAVILQSQGEFEQAALHFRQTLQRDPENASAHNNLGVVLQSQGKLDESLTHYRRAVEIRPEFSRAHNNLGNVLQLQRDLQSAIAHYRRAIQIQPEFAEAHYNLGLALWAQGSSEALAHFETALRRRPGWSLPLARVARILATHPEERARNPKEAVRLAERAAALTQREDAAVLDTLAAAYAASGQFDRALATAARALQLAANGEAADLSHAIEERLALYRQHKPYREPPGTAP